MEDGAERFLQHVGQHVEPAPVRHAEHDFGDAQRAAHLDDRFHRRDHGFGAIKAETLGADILTAQEFLELLGFNQLIQNRPLTIGGELDFLITAFEFFLQEAPFLHIVDVHILKADVTAVIALQNADEFTDGCRLQAQRAADVHRAIQIIAAKAVIAGGEIGRQIADGKAERIKIGRKVTAHAIGADQHKRANRILGSAGNVFRGGTGSRRRSSSPTGGLGCAFGKHTGGIEPARQIIAGQDRPVRPGPTWRRPIFRSGQQGFHIHRDCPQSRDSELFNGT